MSDITELLGFLKKQGVEVSAEAEGAAKKKFDGQVLVPSDRVLAEGMIAIAKDFNDSKTEDLRKFKEQLRKAEAERDELKQVLDTGENTSKKKIEKLLAENERLKSLADAHLSEKKELWKNMAAKIPETMHGRFKFPDEGKELTDDELLVNVGRLQEYIEIGAIKLDGSESSPSHPRGAPGGGERKPDTKAWERLPAMEKIRFGHEEAARKEK